MTIANRVEKLMRQRIVKAFTDADFALVIFERRLRIPTAAGAWRWGLYFDLPAQTIRIIPAKRRYGNANTNSEAGDIENYPYQLIGDDDMDIAEEDTFFWEGMKYVVKSIEQDRDERTLAFATYFGKEN